MKRLDRLISMALAFATHHRLRASDLARQFSVTERTVYRDVRALCTAGLPIEGTAGDGYRMSSSAFLRPLALTEGEAVALAMAATMLSGTADASVRQALASSTAKLESTLPIPARQRVRQFRAETHVASAALPSRSPLGPLAESLGEREVLAIVYDTGGRGGASDREIEPLGLVLAGSRWMLLAYCRLRQDVRAFRVDRIRELRKTGERFRPRSGLSFGEVIERERSKFATSS